MASHIVQDMRTMYSELVNKHSRNKLQHALMRQDWIDKMIKKITSMKENNHAEGVNKVPKLVNSLLENYDVVMINNKRILVKTCNTTQPGKQKRKIVIPLERTFEIVFNAHMSTRHGSTNDMFDCIDKRSFVIAKMCVPILRTVCMSLNPDCATGEVEGMSILPFDTLQHQENPKPMKSTASIAILDMTSQPDNSFKYLLVYRDLETEFVQLRPLSGTDLEDEVAMELTKLFCDLSPPKTIVADTELEILLKAVLERVNTIFDGKISFNACYNYINMDTQIKPKLTYWMLVQLSTSWSVGCHFVQWDMNNVMTENGTPYEKFFGITNVERARKKRARGKNTRAAKKDTSELATTKSKGSLSLNTSQTDTRVPNINCQDNSQISTSSHNSQTPTSDSKDSVILINPVPEPRLVTEHTSKTTQDVNSTAANNSTGSGDNGNSSSNPITLIEPASKSSFVIVEPGVEHVCDSCEHTISDKAYICCVCKKTLHFYCAAMTRNSDGTMDTVCFVCVN